MLTGGYQIINLNDENHSLGTGKVHEGIYEKIEGTRKPILLSGIVVGGVEYHDTYIFPTVNDTSYVAVVGRNPTANTELHINIEDTDVVTFTQETNPTNK